jgi:CxxC motif-containing protein (DUF1111 family)
VHDLFVITGRSDAPSGCSLAQTNFAPQLSSGNVIFRIPTPVFGAGLIEAIDDATILANQSASSDSVEELEPGPEGATGRIRQRWPAVKILLRATDASAGRN